MKQYLPGCMLNVVKRELSCARCKLQNPFLASNLEYVVEHANLCIISSNVGASWCLCFMALLRSFWSKHTLRVPLALHGYVK